MKNHTFTVTLRVTADGRRLPPHVILKIKMLPKELLPTGIVFRPQEKERITLKWENYGRLT